jgi:hypothetical protein
MLHLHMESASGPQPPFVPVAAKGRFEPFPTELKVSVLEQINGCVKWICGPKRKLAKVQRNDQCRSPPGEIDGRRKGCYSVLSCWIGHLLVQLLLSRS